MIKKKLSFTAIVLLLTLCFGSACKPDMKTSLVGKWKSDSVEGWEFKSDNKFERMTEIKIPVTGTYSVEGEDVVLRFDPRDSTSEMPEPIKVKVVITKDKMSLDDGTRTYNYTRE